MRINGALGFDGLYVRLVDRDWDEQTLMKSFDGAILAKFMRIPILTDYTAADRLLAF